MLGPRGYAFTEDSIGAALANRQLLAHLRDLGTITGGPAPFEQRDRSRFLQRPVWPRGRANLGPGLELAEKVIGGLGAVLAHLAFQPSMTDKVCTFQEIAVKDFYDWIVIEILLAHQALAGDSKLLRSRDVNVLYTSCPWLGLGSGLLGNGFELKKCR